MSRKAKLFLTFGIILVLASNFSFCLLVALTSKTTENQYVLTEARFVKAVSSAVSNYLHSVLETAGHENFESERTESEAQPSVVIIDELSTWGGFNEGCMIEGVIYRVGDITPFGELVRVGDGRCYCITGDIVKILRRRRTAQAPLAQHVGDEDLTAPMSSAL